jgi:hypothetical protein
MILAIHPFLLRWMTFNASSMNSGLLHERLCSVVSCRINLRSESRSSTRDDLRAYFPLQCSSCALFLHFNGPLCANYFGSDQIWITGSDVKKT